MKLKVTLGDWSNDGHGMTEVFIVDLPTVINQSELEEMYNLGAGVIGFDLIKQVCRNYEDNRIDLGWYDRLTTLGYEPYDFKKEAGKWDSYPEFDEGEYAYLTTELYLDIYMFFVSVGYEKMIGTNDSFGYRVVSDDMPQVTIGGYGLFYG